MKHFLILGYPRSGTSYAAVAFHKAGFYVTHERDESFTDAVLGRCKRPDGVITGLFKHCRRDPAHYDVVFHQVRHPLNVITSATHMSYESMQDLMQTCRTGHMCEGKLYRVMKTWLLFTDWADSVCQMRYQVEQMPEQWPLILKEIGLNLTITFAQRLDTYVNTYGQKRPKQLTWDDLRACDRKMGTQILFRAQEYGYPCEIPDEG